MPVLLAVLQIAAVAAIAVATVLPRARTAVGVVLVGAALASGAAALLGAGAPRTLTVSHRFSAYVGLQVEHREFPIETTLAPGWVWGAVAAGFCLAWALWAFRQRGGGPSRAFGAPLLLAWSGSACLLVLEKAAAPAALLAPFDLAPDRVMFPATLAGALLLGRPRRRMVELLLYLVLWIAVTRLPLAVFGTVATRAALGTHLDVHATTYFVPPGTGVGIEVEPAAAQQLLWMVWIPHLLMMPFVYLLSTGGFAFLARMWHQHRGQAAA
ncbi:MAG: hypothetical protein KDC87_08205 [Planctomycetes bacterium]|nr:hypothetical protein [Planctomycetota bacterium]MCB9871104.1 hypothetical protein [Planctomycetota bacterium]MCB9888258.1 hypothetical protein [Planctomycetota bacterium]